MAENSVTELQTFDPRGSIEDKVAPVKPIVNDQTIPQEPQEGEETPVQGFKEATIEQAKTPQTEEDGEPPVRYENFLGGQDNPVYTVNEETSLMERVIPPVTYIDFLPQFLLAAEGKNEAPTYARFGTLVEQANQWLQGNQEYTLWKCETVIFKLKSDDSIQTDETLYMESAFGANKFIMGLRLWLMPRLSEAIPVCQIGMATWLPGAKGSMVQDINPIATPVNIYTKMADAIAGINKQIMKKPLQGTIMNVETVVFRMSSDGNEFVSLDPSQTCWVELGSKSRVYIHAVRVFYILGKPEFTQIGYHDEVPRMEQAAMQTIIKFGPFKDTVTKMGVWLKTQKNMRIVNLQSINYKLVPAERSGRWKMDLEVMGHNELSYCDYRYAKILRAFYVTTPKSDEFPYKSINLSTRLFVPVRIQDKDFESFSKTMQRLIKWFNYTKLPPFGVETVPYAASILSYGDVVHENKSDMNVNRNNGRYHLTTVRFYFPSEYTEPPPEISPEVSESWATSWGCVLS